MLRRVNEPLNDGHGREVAPPSLLCRSCRETSGNPRCSILIIQAADRLLEDNCVRTASARFLHPYLRREAGVSNRVTFDPPLTLFLPGPPYSVALALVQGLTLACVAALSVE